VMFHNGDFNSEEQKARGTSTPRRFAGCRLVFGAEATGKRKPEGLPRGDSAW
jgi:hypothetical protein